LIVFFVLVLLPACFAMLDSLPCSLRLFVYAHGFLFLFLSVYKLTGRLSDHSLSFTRYSRFACLSLYLHLSIDATSIYIDKVLYALFCSPKDKSTWCENLVKPRTIYLLPFLICILHLASPDQAR
jgi:hypothetical protein